MSDAARPRWRAAAWIVLLACAAMGPRAVRAQDLVCETGDVEVRRLTFEGNRAFDDARLAAVVQTTPSNRWRRVFGVVGTRRCLDREELPRDSLRLLIYYRRQGYWRAAVQYEVRPLRPEIAEVRFTIREGAPVILDSLGIAGLEGLPAAERARVLRDLPIATGRPFDQLALNSARDTVERRLRNLGFPRAQVVKWFDMDTVIFRATAGLEAAPGPLAHVGEIRVDVDPLAGKGQQIPERMVRRLLGLRRGAVYRERDLITAQRNLYQTEAYSHVEIRPAADSLQARPDSVIVDVHLVEAPMHAARVGAGWGSIDCFRAQGQLIDYNFLRRAQRLELTARVSKIGVGAPLDGLEPLCYEDAKADPFSTKLNYYGSATFRQPLLFGLRNLPTITLYSERRSEFKAYRRTTPIGFVTTLTRDLARRRPLPLSFTYRLEYGETEAQPALFCAVFLACERAAREQLQERQRLAVASATLTRDRTQSELGLSFGPTRGSIVRAEYRHASRYIGSDANLYFNTARGDASAYWRMSSRAVLAARLRVAGVFGQQLSLEAAGQYVPQEERLYAGGPGTVRGFRQNELGPTVYVVQGLDTVVVGDEMFFQAMPANEEEQPVPTGGNTLIVGNLEYRWISPFLPRYLQWAIFTDVGEVWNRAGRTGLNYREVKWTPGAGLRVSTPVGAIRVDVGYNPYTRPPGAVYFNAPPDVEGNAPVYCVSPGNRLRISPRPGGGNPEQEGGVCPATFQPEENSGFFRRLTFNFSIGQAF